MKRIIPILFLVSCKFDPDVRVGQEVYYSDGSLQLITRGFVNGHMGCYTIDKIHGNLDSLKNVRYKQYDSIVHLLHRLNEITPK